MKKIHLTTKNKVITDYSILNFYGAFVVGCSDTSIRPTRMDVKNEHYSQAEQKLH